MNAPLLIISTKFISFVTSFLRLFNPRILFYIINVDVFIELCFTIKLCFSCNLTKESEGP